MNYISQLQEQIKSHEAAQAAMLERVEQLRHHLSLPKFDAVQSDGSRGDWISVADVQRWINYIVEGAHS